MKERVYVPIYLKSFLFLSLHKLIKVKDFSFTHAVFTIRRYMLSEHAKYKPNISVNMFDYGVLTTLR